MRKESESRLPRFVKVAEKSDFTEGLGKVVSVEGRSLAQSLALGMGGSLTSEQALSRLFQP